MKFCISSFKKVLLGRTNNDCLFLPHFQFAWDSRECDEYRQNCNLVVSSLLVILVESATALPSIPRRRFYKRSRL